VKVWKERVLSGITVSKRPCLGEFCWNFFLRNAAHIKNFSSLPYNPVSTSLPHHHRTAFTMLTRSLACLFSLVICVAAAAPASPKAIAEPTAGRYPGTLKLAVDVTDTERKIHRAKLAIPAAPGPMTLLFPQWLPGNHAPNGNVAALAGLIIKANGKPLEWARETINVFAFHIDVPAGATAIKASYDYLTAVSSAQGRVLVTPDITNLQWNSVVLYPAGFNADGILIEASMTFPPTWKFATALEVASQSEGRAKFNAVSLTDLVDSPVYIGRHAKTYDITPNAAPPVRFHVFADNAENLEAKPEQINTHRDMIAQAYKVFGPGPFDRYEFLIAASDTFGGTGGLEHRQFTEIGVTAGYFSKYKESVASRGVVPHEFVHAWDGKFRRPADLNTRNFNEPMQNTVLWVYEGQTTYWTDILAARSRMYSPDEARDTIARTVAHMEKRAGRLWRNLQDTTNEPIVSARGRAQSWPSWQRSADYYPEGLMLWLDTDIKLRELTNEKKSLDDFARAFYAAPAKNFATRAYTFDDVVNTLNSIAAHDWRSFLRARLDNTATSNPLDALGRSGWKLVFTEKPNLLGESSNKIRGNSDFVYSLGFTVGKQDVIQDVNWGGPAFEAEIAAGSTLVVVNGRAYKAELLNHAITAAKKDKKPIELLVKSDDTYRTVSNRYVDGIRHPHLERVEGTKDRLGAVLAPLP
jgi:predicted metalloprotease with PDZ domain